MRAVFSSRCGSYRKGPAEGLFAAPTHGETFGPTGTKVAGPAQRDLAQYATSVQGEDLAIDVSRVVPGHVNDTSAGPPGEGRPWNSGPNSFCDGAVSTDGPVPRVGSTSPGPSSVPPNTSGEATAETTPTVGGTTTTPTPEGRNGWQELEAAVGLSATTVNTGDSIDAVLTIRNPNSYAVTASVAILEPNLLLTHASGTPSYRFFAWPPLEWPNRIHDSIRFDPGQVITVSGHVTLSDEEGAVGPGTYSAQAIMTSHMVPVAWEVRQEPTSLIVQEP